MTQSLERAKRPSGVPNWIIWAIAITGTVTLLTLSHGEKPAETMAAKYPAPWRSEFNLNITRALAKHRSPGCGEYWYRSAAATRGEYLVYCGNVGASWSAYLVWEGSGDVLGPLKTSPDIAPPR